MAPIPMRLLYFLGNRLRNTYGTTFKEKAGVVCNTIKQTKKKQKNKTKKKELNNQKKVSLLFFEFFFVFEKMIFLLLLFILFQTYHDYCVLFHVLRVHHCVLSIGHASLLSVHLPLVLIVDFSNLFKNQK